MKFVIATVFFVSHTAALCLSNKATQLFPRVITPLGSIEGYYKSSSSGRQYEAYEGIPYAQPPTGENRFRVAKRILPWTDVLIAKQFSSTCVQYSPVPGQEPPGNVTGSEDCLYMNVYTPITDDDDDDGVSISDRNKTRTHLLPVIFFIHGGFFQFGSGSQYGAKYLMDRNVMLITFNYRLGPLGFLSTEDAIVPGNMGLKDQVIALHWVKDNIRFFGGDPSRVTIFGHSAGGASVHYHIVSSISSGLFQRGMSISGTALNPWAQAENSLEKAKQLATIVGCPSYDIKHMVDCLRIRPAYQITQAIGEFMPFLYNPPAPFGPVVEKGGDDDFLFIDRSPIETITSGKGQQNVPWITSVVSAEGLITTSEFVARKNLLNELNENWESLAPHLLDFNYTLPKTDHSAIARLIRQHYLGRSPIIDETTVNQIVQMAGDRLFVYIAERAARLQAQANQSPVRFYYFSYRGAHSFSEATSGTSENFGVSHLDDLGYVLDSFFDPTTTVEDRDMQKLLIDLWESFAANGIPDVGVKWPDLGRSCTDNFRYLHISGPNEIGIERASNFGDKNFWESINFKENIL